MTGHCYATERLPLNVNNVTRHKKAVFSLGKRETFFSATGDTK